MWSAQAAAHHAGCSGGLVQAPSKAVAAAAAEDSIGRRRARAGAAEVALRSKGAAQANVPRPSRRQFYAKVLEPSIADHKHLPFGREICLHTCGPTSPQQLVLSGCRESTSEREMGQHLGRGLQSDKRPRSRQHPRVRRVSRSRRRAFFWRYTITITNYLGNKIGALEFLRQTYQDKASQCVT